MDKYSPRGWTSGPGSAVASFETDKFGTITIPIDAFARNPAIASINKDDADYHEYGPVYFTGIKATEAPMHRVMDALREQPTPSPIFPKDFAGPGFIFDGSVPGSPGSIVYVTDTSGWKWHWLNPGVV